MSSDCACSSDRLVSVKLPGKILPDVFLFRILIILDALLSLWNPFWTHFYNLGVTFGQLWVHLLNKKTGWGPKCATAGAKGQSPTKKAPFWTQIWNHFLKNSSFPIKKTCLFSVCFPCLVYSCFWYYLQQVETLKYS